MSVRLFHKNARLVLVTSRDGVGAQTWWSPHRAPRDWRVILAPALQLLGLNPDSGTGGPLVFRLGSMDWTNSRFWSTITLRFTGGSEKKRELVAAALLKAARYRLNGPAAGFAAAKTRSHDDTK